MSHISRNLSVSREPMLVWLLALVPAAFAAHYFWTVPLLGDAGAFAGIATHMGNGAVLYKDVWDNKAPGIFFLFRLVQWISGNHIHAFHVLQLLMLWVFCGTFLNIFWHFYRWKAWPVLILMPLSLRLFAEWPYYYSGHFTEEYGSIFLFAATGLLLCGTAKSKAWKWRALGTGFLTCAAICIKEPFLFPASVLLVFAWHSHGKKFLIWSLAGMAIPALLFAMYLTVHGAWNGYSEYIQFAFGYAGGNTDKLATLNNEISKLADIWQSLWVKGSWIFLLLLVPVYGRKFHRQNRNAWFLFLLLSLASLVFLVMGNQCYAHYLLPLILFACVTLAFGAIRLLELPYAMIKRTRKPAILNAILIVLVLWMFHSGLHETYIHFAKEKYLLQRTEGEERADFLKAVSEPGLVLVEEQSMGRVYQYLNRSSGNRFPSPYYVYFADNSAAKWGSLHVQQLIEGLERNKPLYLISGRQYNAGFYLSGKLPEIENRYPVMDSVKTADGNTVFVRKRR